MLTIPFEAISPPLVANSYNLNTKPQIDDYSHIRSTCHSDEVTTGLKHLK
jgi:hypothetical protein